VLGLATIPPIQLGEAVSASDAFADHAAFVEQLSDDIATSDDFVFGRPPFSLGLSESVSASDDFAVGPFSLSLNETGSASDGLFSSASFPVLALQDYADALDSLAFALIHILPPPASRTAKLFPPSRSLSAPILSRTAEDNSPDRILTGPNLTRTAQATVARTVKAPI
jgi:hypothetical protein